MPSQGPNSCSSGSTVSGGSTIAWTDPGNITASDNARATCTLNLNEVSDDLTAKTFGFSLPDGTVSGIEVEWEKSGGSDLIDQQVQLIFGGAEVGNNKSTGATWPAADTYVSYGGAADLWGWTPSPSNINDNSFGVIIVAKNATGGLPIMAEVDHVRITVTYTVAADAPPMAQVARREVHYAEIFE